MRSNEKSVTVIRISIKIFYLFFFWSFLSICAGNRNVGEDENDYSNNDNLDFRHENGAHRNDISFKSIYEDVDCPSIKNQGNCSFQIALQICTNQIELHSVSILIKQTHIIQDGLTTRREEEDAINVTQAFPLDSVYDWVCSSERCENDDFLLSNECSVMLNITLPFQCRSANCTVEHRFIAEGRTYSLRKIRSSDILVVSNCGTIATSTSGFSLSTLPTSTPIDVVGFDCSLCFGGLSNPHDSSYSLSVSRIAAPPNTFNFQVDLCQVEWCASNNFNQTCMMRNFTIFLDNQNTMLSSITPFNNNIYPIGQQNILPASFFLSSNAVNIYNTTFLSCTTNACTTGFSNPFSLFMMNEGNCISAIFSFQYSFAQGDQSCYSFQPSFSAAIELQGGLLSHQTQPTVPLITSIPSRAIHFAASRESCDNTAERVLSYNCWVNTTDGVNNGCPVATSNYLCRYLSNVKFLNYTIFDEDLSFSLTFRASVEAIAPLSHNSHPVSPSITISLESTNAIFSCPDNSRRAHDLVCNYATPLNITTSCDALFNVEESCLASDSSASIAATTINCNDFRLQEQLANGDAMMVDFSFHYAQSIKSYSQCNLQVVTKFKIQETCENICCTGSSEMLIYSDLLNLFDLIQ